MNRDELYVIMSKLSKYMGTTMEPFDLPVYNFRIDVVDMEDFIDFSIKSRTKIWKDLYTTYKGEYTMTVIFENHQNSGILEYDKFIELNYKLFIRYNGLKKDFPNINLKTNVRDK